MCRWVLISTLTFHTTASFCADHFPLRKSLRACVFSACVDVYGSIASLGNRLRVGVIYSVTRGCSRRCARRLNRLKPFIILSVYSGHHIGVGLVLGFWARLGVLGGPVVGYDVFVRVPTDSVCVRVRANYLVVGVDMRFDDVRVQVHALVVGDDLCVRAGSLLPCVVGDAVVVRSVSLLAGGVDGSVSLCTADPVRVCL